MRDNIDKLCEIMRAAVTALLGHLKRPTPIVSSGPVHLNREEFDGGPGPAWTGPMPGAEERGRKMFGDR